MRAGGIVARGTFLAAELPRKHEEIYTLNLHFAALSKKQYSPVNPVLAGKELLNIIQSGNFKIYYSKASMTYSSLLSCLIKYTHTFLEEKPGKTLCFDSDLNLHL